MEICSSESINSFCYNEKYYINDFGTHIFEENDKVNEIGEKERSGYHILFVKNGTLSFEYKNKKCVLDKNSLIICCPGEYSKYYFGSAYSESYYISFGGTRIPELFEDCNIHSGIYRCENSVKVLRMFEKLIKACETASNYRKSKKSQTQVKCKIIKAFSFLVAFICEISEGINVISPNPTVVAQTMDEIHSHYNERIPLEEIAKKNGITKQKLIQLFQEDAHLTPNKYQKMLQIERAKQLLISSNMNITEIAQRIGFSDPLYFSRIFKDYTSYSPTNYRKFNNSNNI